MGSCTIKLSKPSSLWKRKVKAGQEMKKRKEEWEQADNKQRYGEKGYLSKKKIFLNSETI